MDGGVCNRSLDEIQRLLAEPRACIDDLQCPDGSFCNSFRGSCDWQCLADSDCGGLGACGCDGRCAIGGDGTPSPPATCDRDTGLLLALRGADSAGVRQCRFDDECPNGSACDTGTNTCSWSCLATDHAEHGCGEGQVCDCFGQCVSLSADPSGRPSVKLSLPNLDVSPAHLSVVECDSCDTGAWAPRRVDLALWTMDENTASRSADTTVVIAAGKGVEVSCQPGDRNTIQYARSCETTGWVFGSENGSTLHRAEAHVWIRPTDASLDSWSVTVLSRGVTNAPQHVTIERVSNDTPPLSPIEGTYSGTITLVDVYRFSDTAGTTAPITLDVQARVLPDLGNDISEAFEIVDPIGVFVRGNVARLLPADDAQSSLFAYMDEASSETAYYSRSHNAATGTLTGSVRMFAEVDESGDNVASLTWKFDLRRTGPLVACTRDADCVSAQRCDRERHTCLASASEIPASVNGFTISEEWLRALRSAQNRSVSAVGVAGALYLPPLYDEPTGVGRATGSESIDIFGAEAFDRVSGPREGWIACDESIARWGEGVAEALGTQARSEFCVNPTCSQRRDPATACSSMYYEQGALNEDLASTSIPCFLATPAATPAPNGRLAAVRAVAGWEATCEGLYANLARSSRDVPATFSGFLSESCVRPAGQHVFVIRDENGEDRHHVYLCRRYKEALLGPFSSRRKAERSLCYEPGTGARPLLASTHFDDGRGNVSHEELCQSGLPPRGIDLIHYQDRTDLLGVDQLDSSELLSSCAHELDARPPAIGGNLGLAWNALLNGGVCFSAAQFYAAMSALRSSFDRDFSLSSSLLHRLLRQWLELHSFVAHET
jgi:hypothetical protein